MGLKINSLRFVATGFVLVAGVARRGQGHINGNIVFALNSNGSILSIRNPSMNGRSSLL